MLTCVDIFTRWTIAIPLKSKKAQHVGEAVMNDILCRFGSPVQIISDNGAEFVNGGLQYLYKMWEVAPIFTGGYNSRANPVERWHATLHPAMTSFLQSLVLIGTSIYRQLYSIIMFLHVQVLATRHTISCLAANLRFCMSLFCQRPEISRRGRRIFKQCGKIWLIP